MLSFNDWESANEFYEKHAGVFLEKREGGYLCMTFSEYEAWSQGETVNPLWIKSRITCGANS